MSKENPNSRERYIMLYSDEYPSDVWEEMCDAMGVSCIANEIRINFDYNDVIVTE